MHRLAGKLAIDAEIPLPSDPVQSVLDPASPPDRGAQRWSLFLLCLLILALTGIFDDVRQYEPVDDELRYAAVVKNAEERGHWLDLRKANGELYRNKPPLIFWLGALLGQLGGELGAVASIATRLMAVGTVLFTADLTRRWYGALAGGVAGVAIVTAPHFLEVGRELRTDSAATLGISMAIWSLSLRDSPRARPALFMTGTVIALLGKGLVGLVPLGCALACLAQPSQRFLRSGRFWAWLALLAIPAAWEIQLETLHEREIVLDRTCDAPQSPPATDGDRETTGGREPIAASGTVVREPDCPNCGRFAADFLRAGLLGWLPWTLFLALGAWRDLRSLFAGDATSEARFRALLTLAWATFLILGWATQDRSYERYFLLLLPPFALLAGREAARLGVLLAGARRTGALLVIALAAGWVTVALSMIAPRARGIVPLEEMRAVVERELPRGDLPVVAFERSEFRDELDLAYADLLADRCVRYVTAGGASPVLVRTREWDELAGRHPEARRVLGTRVMTLVEFSRPRSTGDGSRPASSR